MTEQNQASASPVQPPSWIPLRHSFSLIFRRKQIFGWSLLLTVITIVITWAGYSFAVDFMDQLTGNFLHSAPATASIWGWVKYSFWLVGSWLYSFITRIAAFYLAFLVAYSLTTPGYSFLSASSEKIHAGELFEPDLAMNLSGIAKDIWEGIKIALFGVLITVAALLINLIPGIGQILVLILYTYYSALMFIDYPASRRRWSLGKKIHWLTSHSITSLRIGILPALLSMIPVVNIFFIAMIFPLLTIHSTINFAAIELQGQANGN